MAFGAESTAAEVAAGIDLSGRRAIVTGGSSGIGVETARALAGAGAEVTLAVRDTGAGDRTAAEITATTGNAPSTSAGSTSPTRRRSPPSPPDWSGPLHLLVNNAGVMALPDLQLTPEGWELQFATNHLGHFALALGLHDALAAAGDARIVSLSSARPPALAGGLRRPELQLPPVRPVLAYGQSKTANVLFAVEATRRWAGDGITANAVHPGAIATRTCPGTWTPRPWPPSALGRVHVQDARAGRRDERPGRHLAPARGRRRPLLRGLQRGGGRRPADHGEPHLRRRGLRARHGERRAPLERLGGAAGLSS